MTTDRCGYAITDKDGEQQPCDRPATGWRWYQDVGEHEDMLDVACDWHANEGGREMHELRRWKAEALPVIGGLQELGRALGLRLGTSITGPAAAEKARELRGEVEALRATVARVRVAVELVTQDVRAQRGDHIAGLVEDSFAAHFARAALTDPSGEGK